MGFFFIATFSAFIMQGASAADRPLDSKTCVTSIKSLTQESEVLRSALMPFKNYSIEFAPTALGSRNQEPVETILKVIETAPERYRWYSFRKFVPVRKIRDFSQLLVGKLIVGTSHQSYYTLKDYQWDGERLMPYSQEVFAGRVISAEPLAIDQKGAVALTISLERPDGSLKSFPLIFSTIAAQSHADPLLYILGNVSENSVSILKIDIQDLSRRFLTGVEPFFGSEIHPKDYDLIKAILILIRDLPPSYEATSIVKILKGNAKTFNDRPEHGFARLEKDYTVNFLTELSLRILRAARENNLVDMGTPVSPAPQYFRSKVVDEASFRLIISDIEKIKSALSKK